METHQEGCQVPDSNAEGAKKFLVSTECDLHVTIVSMYSSYD